MHSALFSFWSPSGIFFSSLFKCAEFCCDVDEIGGRVELSSRFKCLRTQWSICYTRNQHGSLQLNKETIHNELISQVVKSSYPCTRGVPVLKKKKHPALK